jgi:autotransporter-associated beta strand protein
MSGGAATENLGALTVKGYANFFVTGSSTLNFSDFVRSDRGMMRFSDTTNLGTTSKFLPPPSVANDLVGANTTATNKPILPYATGFQSVNGYVPVTLTAAGGIRALATSELASSLIAGSNVSILSSNTTNDASVTINSLSIPGLGGNGSLTITSGLLIVTGSSFSNALNFGAAEAHIVGEGSSTTMTGALSGTGGLTKSGTGTVVLPAVNNISGQLTIMKAGYHLRPHLS